MGPKERSPLKAFSALTLEDPRSQGQALSVREGGNEEEAQDESETSSNPDDNEEADMIIQHDVEVD
jgi:hypothetical protein